MRASVRETSNGIPLEFFPILEWNPSNIKEHSILDDSPLSSVAETLGGAVSVPSILASPI